MNDSLIFRMSSQFLSHQCVVKYRKLSCNTFHDLTLWLSVGTTKFTQTKGRRIMKANFTMRMAAGCSILVAVCQTAAMAGGFGGGAGMHSVSSGNHSSFQSSSHVSNFNTSNFKST